MGLTPPLSPKPRISSLPVILVMDTRNIRKQNNSPLINQLKLVHDTNTISYIITGLQSNSITPHLDSSDRIQLPLVSTLCEGPKQLPSEQRQATVRQKQHVGVWMSSFIKPLSSGVSLDEKSYTWKRVCV